MPFNGSGIYELPVTTHTPAVDGTTIDASAINSFTADLETALTLCIAKDGQTVSPTISTPTITTPTINGNSAVNGDLVLDATSAQRLVDFITATKRTYLAGQTDGDISLFDAINTRTVFIYSESGDTFTVRNLVAPDAVLTTPILTDSVITVPTFRALANSTTVIGTSPTKIAFANEIFDKTADYDTTLSRFTPDEAGVYHVYSQISPAVVGSDRFFMRIYKNGASHLQKTKYLSDTFTTAETADIEGLVELNGTTDYIEIFAFRAASLTSASVLSSTTDNYFQAHKVSA